MNLAEAGKVHDQIKMEFHFNHQVNLSCDVILILTAAENKIIFSKTGKHI